MKKLLYAVSLSSSLLFANYALAANQLAITLTGTNAPTLQWISKYDGGTISWQYGELPQTINGSSSTDFAAIDYIDGTFNLDVVYNIIEGGADSQVGIPIHMQLNTCTVQNETNIDISTAQATYNVSTQLNGTGNDNVKCLVTITAAGPGTPPQTATVNITNSTP